MNFRPLRLPGTYAIELRPIYDERGYFLRVYDRQAFYENDLDPDWKQENQSFSKHPGIIRGLHYQAPPHAEAKLVRVSMGRILDVFVDLRTDSPTFGQWDSIELSDQNFRMVFIPKGFAHGFCTLTAETLVHYRVDAKYAPHAEGGIRWNDETLNIEWPIDDPILSDRDKALPYLSDWASPF